MELLLLMGGRCELCGADNLDRLEIDHPDGRDYDPARLSSTHRISVYWREWFEGLTRLLCRHCNASLGRRRQLEQRRQQAERKRNPDLFTKGDPF